MDDQTNKKVDENWKAQVQKEKKEAQDSQASYHEPTFVILAKSYIMQAMIAMGKLENPVTGKIEANLDQARFLIDTLAILKEKTKGNLLSDEETLIDDALYNLRMMYVEAKI